MKRTLSIILSFVLLMLTSCSFALEPIPLSMTFDEYVKMADEVKYNQDFGYVQAYKFFSMVFTHVAIRETGMNLTHYSNEFADRTAEFTFEQSRVKVIRKSSVDGDYLSTEWLNTMSEPDYTMVAALIFAAYDKITHVIYAKDIALNKLQVSKNEVLYSIVNDDITVRYSIQTQRDNNYLHVIKVVLSE